jgi:hypothetical protein
MKEKQVLSHKAKKAAKRLFKKPQHSTRAFTSADYTALPKGESNGAV